MTESSFASRLNQLFDSLRDSEGKPWTNVAVAKAMREVGFPGAPGYLSQLRNGQRDNPTLSYVKALATVLGVSVSYFADDPADAQRLRDDRAVAAATRDERIEGIAMRARGLDAESLRTIEEILDSVRKLKGLPETP